MSAQIVRGRALVGQGRDNARDLPTSRWSAGLCAGGQGWSLAVFNFTDGAKEALREGTRCGEHPSAVWPQFMSSAQPLCQLSLVWLETPTSSSVRGCAGGTGGLAANERSWLNEK